MCGKLARQCDKGRVYHDKRHCLFQKKGPSMYLWRWRYHCCIVINTKQTMGNPTLVISRSVS